MVENRLTKHFFILIWRKLILLIFGLLIFLLIKQTLITRYVIYIFLLSNNMISFIFIYLMISHIIIFIKYKSHISYFSVNQIVNLVYLLYKKIIQYYLCNHGIFKMEQTGQIE